VIESEENVLTAIENIYLRERGNHITSKRTLSIFKSISMELQSVDWLSVIANAQCQVHKVNDNIDLNQLIANEIRFDLLSFESVLHTEQEGMLDRYIGTVHAVNNRFKGDFLIELSYDTEHGQLEEALVSLVVRLPYHNVATISVEARLTGLFATDLIHATELRKQSSSIPRGKQEIEYLEGFLRRNDIESVHPLTYVAQYRPEEILILFSKGSLLSLDVELTSFLIAGLKKSSIILGDSINLLPLIKANKTTTMVGHFDCLFDNLSMFAQQANLTVNTQTYLIMIARVYISLYRNDAGVKFDSDISNDKVLAKLENIEIGIFDNKNLNSAKIKAKKMKIKAPISRKPIISLNDNTSL
tara:strand:- start:1188 stop:2261 length:1074 start_codon:yes stop_codon:yes gene_type:complete